MLSEKQDSVVVKRVCFQVRYPAFDRQRSVAAACVAVAVLAAGSLPLAAVAQQPGPVPAAGTSGPAIVPLGSSDGRTLNDALARLARDPRDASALIDAGKAALAMGDVDAAVGFFNRADQVSPGNATVKAGLAGALVRSENPFDAIPLFAEAEKAGVMDGALAADRGLAYDLVGDNEAAQRYYQLALSRGSSDEVIRRLALSYAIAGDKRGSEQALTPLLQRNDKAGWRTRAFSLAILGQAEDAVAIAYQTLPQDLATAISPYLRYMPRLTPAQQAAAANFGHFPRASEIGRDDPRVAQFAPNRRPVVASADSALIPKGEPLGRNSRSRGRSQPVRAAQSPSSNGRQVAAISASARTAPPEIQPSRVQVAEGAPQPSARLAAVAQPPEPKPSRSSPAALSVSPERPIPAQELPPAPPPAVASQQGPGFVSLETAPVQAPAVSLLSTNLPPDGTDTAMLPVTPGPAPLGTAPDNVSAVTPVAPPAAAVSEPVRRDAPGIIRPASPEAIQGGQRPTKAPARPRLAEAFADLALPASREALPQAGAVDIRKIVPARDKQKVDEEKPVRPTHPSRIWVQIATGRDKSALAYDWRRMLRESPEAFRGKQPSISAWGQTNRLLTGPFPSEAAANAFIAQLRRADVAGAFLWTSPAGQVVDGLLARDAAVAEPAKDSKASKSTRPDRRRRRN